MKSSILIAALTLCHSGSDIGGEQFAAILKASYSAVHSLSFLYEGEIRCVGPTITDRARAGIDQYYQGTYVYRVPGDRFVDNYIRAFDASRPLIRTTIALSGSRLEEIRSSPDWKDSGNKLKVGTGGALSFLWPGSPEHIYHAPQLAEVAQDVSGYNYKCEGWATIQGRSCLVVQLDFVWHAGPNAERQTRRFWIDVERGAHPLRVEHLVGNRLLTRTRDVQLEEVRLPEGGTTWIPVKAVHESFLWKDQYHEDPVIRETVGVVSGTITVNQALPDEVFTAKHRDASSRAVRLKSFIPANGRPNIRQEFEGKMKGVARAKHDGAGVEETLDRLVEQARKQADSVEAGSRVRTTWTRTVVLQSTLIAIGTCVLVIVLIFRIRGR